MQIDFFRTASRVGSLPVLSRFSPPVDRKPTTTEVAGFLESQRLARRGIAEVAALVREGWTEKQAARLINDWFRDHGVKAFFHEGFAWYGERTRFDGILTYGQFLPSNRRLREGEVFILDVAPILDGYVCDIGYTASLGEHAGLVKAKKLLAELRKEIPELFRAGHHGEDIWHQVDERIRGAGYHNVHKLYPFGVLGHRVHRVPAGKFRLPVMNFGWQSYWALVSRGLFGQLLNNQHRGTLTGLWAVEPHLGGDGFGAKFEEILVVPEGTGRDAAWLDPDGFGVEAGP